MSAITPHAPETPDSYGAFPRLTDDQVELLLEHGDRRRTRVGDVLFREGEDSSELFVILEGMVAIVQGYRGPDERVISVHGPGRFLGEVDLLTDQPSFTTAVVTEAGEVLAVPAARLRELAGQEPALAGGPPARLRDSRWGQPLRGGSSRRMGSSGARGPGTYSTACVRPRGGG